MASIFDKGNFLHETDIDMLDAESVSPPKNFDEYVRRQHFVSPPVDCTEYMRCVHMSGGFDVPKLNGGHRLFGVITPVTVEDDYDQYERFTKLAIQQLNKDNQNANFVLERIVKVCVQVAGPLNYFITFKAKNVVDGVIKTYQSKVCWIFPKSSLVEFVRLKPGRM